MCINIYEWVKNKTDLENDCYHFAQEGKRGFVNCDLLGRMGFKAGPLDYFFSRRNDQYSGLWIEVKVPGKSPTKEQKVFIKQQIKNGYFADWFDTVEDVIGCIKWFYNIS